MDVVVIGGHGKVAQRLLLALQRDGHRTRGVVRNRDHSFDLKQLGAEPIVADVEQGADLAEPIRGADAVVFAAGAGPGSGPERKQTMDLGGAVILIDAAKSEGVARYLMISSMGAADPSQGPQRMRPYLEAKAEADQHLVASGLDYTIVRPGSLTDEPGTGMVSAASHLGRGGQVSRDDVAQTLAAVLWHDNTIAKTFELLAGETPIEAAVQAL